MNRKSLLLTMFISLPAMTLGGSSHASELRFSETAAGNVVATGNALGLSKELDANGPGTEDSIGTFSSLDGNSVDDTPANAGNPWPAGTTNDWTLNGAEAQLVLPAESEVLYAELVWGGSSAYNTEDVRAFLDDPVTLSFGGDMIEVDPDGTTALDIDETSAQNFAARYYMRSADVTTFVAQHGAGAYGVSGVPATQDTEINSLNAAGWTLVVAYRNSEEPIRNLTVFVGGSFVDEDSEEDYDFAGFCTPPSGDFEGRVVISAIEGDTDLIGDSLGIAETAADPFVLLEGPNNPVDNFFASQINGEDGALDDSGTFGDLNHDATNGTATSGGRQSWDVTTIGVSSTDGHLASGQTSAVLRAQTTGDSFVATVAAFGIQVNAPDFSGENTSASASPMALMIDEAATVTIDIENTGMVAAEDLVFSAPLPEGLELDAFTLDGNPGDVDGDPVDAAALGSGVSIGDITAGMTRQIELVVRSVSEPTDPSGDYIITPQWDYSYVSCVGEDPLTEPHSTPPVTIEFTPTPDTTGGLDDSTGGSASATGGETSNSASASGSTTGADGTGGMDETGTGSASDSAGQVGDDGGCGCSTNEPRMPWALALLGGLALVRRRRRD